MYCMCSYSASLLLLQRQHTRSTDLYAAAGVSLNGLSWGPPQQCMQMALILFHGCIVFLPPGLGPLRASINGPFT